MDLVTTKRLALAIGEMRGAGFTLNEAIAMIDEAHEAACDDLNYFERRVLLRNADKLLDAIPHLEPEGALELLAVLGEFMERSE